MTSHKLIRVPPTRGSRPHTRRTTRHREGRNDEATSSLYPSLRAWDGPWGRFFVGVTGLVDCGGSLWSARSARALGAFVWSPRSTPGGRAPQQIPAPETTVAMTNWSMLLGRSRTAATTNPRRTCRHREERSDEAIPTHLEGLPPDLPPVTDPGPSPCMAAPVAGLRCQPRSHAAGSAILRARPSRPARRGAPRCSLVAALLGPPTPHGDPAAR